MTRLLHIAFSVLFLGLAATSFGVGQAGAQAGFAPAIRVNDKAITAYEIDQRIKLLRALGAPGDLQKEARDRLIDERLQVQAAEQLDIAVTEEQVRTGVEEFAQRANTSADNFLAVIGRNGVAPESFLAFVEAGLLWREVVRQRFAQRVRISDAEVDRAIELSGAEGGARVLLSEIILPARNPEEAASAEERAAELSRINGFEAFAAAARNFSAAPSRERGGRIDWLPLANLPPELRTRFLTMRPGELTEPLRIQNVIAIFQLRALEELPLRRPDTQSVDYAQFLFPGGTRADADRLAGRIDTCDDLYGAARRLPPEVLRRQTQSPSEIPADIAAELARLDADEISTRLNFGGAPMLLMLCERTTAANAETDRDAIRQQLRNQRIGSYADAYLGELRAEAVIVDLQG